MADKSRRAILVCALSVMATIALGVPPALAVNAENAPLIHEGPWPIRNGYNYQPTEQELRVLHQEDVTPDQAREIDRLYDQLLHPAPTDGLRCCRHRLLNAREAIRMVAAQAASASGRKPSPVSR
jgi:hypothetical protein